MSKNPWLSLHEEAQCDSLSRTHRTPSGDTEQHYLGMQPLKRKKNGDFTREQAEKVMPVWCTNAVIKQKSGIFSISEKGFL